MLTGVARGGSRAFGGTSAAAVLGFGLTLVVTRGLDGASAGQFFSATALFLVLQTLFAFGVAAGVVRFVPRLRALGREADVPALLILAVVPVAVAALAGAVVLWFSSSALAGVFDNGVSESNVSSFRLLSLFLFPGVLEIVAVECTRAFGNITRYVLIQQIFLPLSRPVLVLLALALDAPLWGIVLAWLLPLLFALGLAFLVVTRAMTSSFGTPLPWPTRTKPLPALAREYWLFTGARGIASIVDILLTWLDVLIVAAVVSASQAAIYAAASRFITSGTLVLQALRLSIAPELSAALARNDKARAGEMYRVSTQWVLLSSWPLYIVMGVFAPTVLGLFGAGYTSGATAMSILCAAMLVAMAAGNVGTVLLMGGKSSWVLGDKIVVLGINVAANVLLIPPMGISGAALAWAITIVIDSAIAFAQVQWGLGLSSRGRAIFLAAGLAAGCYAGGGLAVRAIWGSNLTTLVLSTLAISALYLALVWRKRDLLDLPMLLAGLRAERLGPSG
jgi:O-antigen/teichoic acid export membrane protein